MGQPKERSAKKNVSVEKYDKIRRFDGTLGYGFFCGNHKDLAKSRNF
jgi:hypothetical protein